MKYNLDKTTIIKIITEIKSSVVRDITPIINCYKDKKNWIDLQQPGFWTIPRMIFPEIDGLARLRYGRINELGSGEDSVRFMEEYFCKPEYKKISGFLWHVFRLGLLHSHFPKPMSILGKNRGWGISFRLNKTETLMHLEFLDKKNKQSLILDAEEFYKDFLQAVDNYIKDFNNLKKEKELTNNFSEVYICMVFPSSKKTWENKSYLQNLDFNFFK